MKRLALVLGVLFLLLGIAGFAGLYDANTVHSAIYAGAGVIGLIFALSRRRQLMPSQGTGRDLRDVDGV